MHSANNAAGYGTVQVANAFRAESLHVNELADLVAATSRLLNQSQQLQTACHLSHHQH